MNYYTTREARNEAVSMIQDAINDGRIDAGTNVDEIHHEVFNTDYFIVGRYEAEKWLSENAGVVNAIGTIQEYENDNFGEVNTDLSEAEHIANMYMYIAGEEVLNSLDTISNNWDSMLDEEMIEQLKEELENY